MSRLDYYVLAGVDGFVLEVQASLMNRLATTVVVPLTPLHLAAPPIRRLNPIFDINGEQFVLVTQSLSAVARKALGKPTGALGEAAGYEVTTALDLLLLGV